MPRGIFLAHNVVNKQSEMRDFLSQFRVMRLSTIGYWLSAIGYQYRPPAIKNLKAES